MNTGSTKSRRKGQAKSLKQSAKAESSLLPTPEPEPSEPRGWTWLVCCLAILLVAGILRFYDLDLVPLHHDEGVNGNFLVHLVREGKYQYDPANYHGPSLYYFSAVFAWIVRFLFGIEAANKYGLTTEVIRGVTGLFGLGTIGLILGLRQRLGAIGVLCAATLVAVSPGAVYLSRYFIHETLFVFFTLAIIVCSLRYYDERHPIYLILTAASTALLFATKETIIINLPVVVIAFASTHLYLWLTNMSGPNPAKYSGEPRSVGEWLSGNVERLGGAPWLLVWGIIAVIVFVTVSVLFFSSFFTNFPKGVYDSLRTFQVWTKTGQAAHVHPFWKYVEWLGLQESPILFLSVVGAAIAVWRPKNLLALFCTFWAFGTLAAYSLVPYKTPWLTLNFIIPLAIVSGYALQEIYRFGGYQLHIVAAILLLAIGLCTYQTVDLNFFNYDNDKTTIELKSSTDPVRLQYYTYVYAHTRRETLNLVKEIDRIAQSSREGNKMGITIVSPEYWPLPWYLRDYTRVGYFGRMASSTEPVVVASEGQRPELLANFGDRYDIIDSGLNAAGSYPLRPGVELILLVRRDRPHN